MLQQHEKPAKAQIEFVTFAAGGQVFCVEITQIREIRRWAPVTALPHSPQDVVGVINLRGSVIPIYDLACRFGLGVTQIDKRNVFIIADIDGKTFGILVESVSEILSVSADEVQATPDVKSEATRQSILGVLSISDEMARIVDLRSVIADEPVVAA